MAAYARPKIKINKVKIICFSRYERGHIMKKLLFVLSLTALLVGCAKEPAGNLPPVEGTTYSVTLTPENSTLTGDDSTTATRVELSAKEDANVKYTVEIGVPCYVKTLGSGLKEIVVKPNAYIKSISNYTVDRLVVDFYGGKGINHKVYAKADGTGNEVEYHTSEVAPVDPNDDGTVYEYPINGTEWGIYNKTEYNKPAFYSVTIIFSK